MTVLGAAVVGSAEEDYACLEYQELSLMNSTFQDHLEPGSRQRSAS